MNATWLCTADYRNARVIKYNKPITAKETVPLSQSDQFLLQTVNQKENFIKNQLFWWIDKSIIDLYNTIC